MGRVILCDSKEGAFELSEQMWDEWRNPTGRLPPKGPDDTKYLFGVLENLLSGQFGLDATDEYWGKLPSKYHQMPLRHSSRLWINERFVNGDSFLSLGSGPLGLGIIEPSILRSQLVGQFKQSVTKEIREAGRKYTLQVCNRAREVIEQINKDKFIARKHVASMNPYQFEELIAELLASQGFDVFLTRRSRDQGRDIIASYSEDGTPKLMMVECKNRKPGTTLGPVEARALVGQLDVERRKESGFERAMLVTSADKIGPSALDIEETIVEFSIKDYEAICEWASQYGSFRNGLWLPKEFEPAFNF